MLDSINPSDPIGGRAGLPGDRDDAIEAHVGPHAQNVVVGRNNVQNINHFHYGGRTPPIPLQKPARPQHFVGRRAELAQLIDQLQPGRIITLCGAGGIGKTALAAEAIWTPSGR